MATLLLKNVPDKLRDRLRRTAREHKRSMNQQAILALAESLDALQPLPPAVRPRGALDNRFIARAKRSGRA